MGTKGRNWAAMPGNNRRPAHLGRVEKVRELIASFLCTFA
jgi:hypothetical protein